MKTQTQWYVEHSPNDWSCKYCNSTHSFARFAVTHEANCPVWYCTRLEITAQNLSDENRELRDVLDQIMGLLDDL